MRSTAFRTSVIAGALALVTASASVFAQSVAGGAYVGGSVGLQSPGARFSDASATATFGATSHSFVPGFFAGYGQVLNKALYLGAEVGYQFSGAELDDTTVTTTRASGKIKNAWEITAVPGVVLSDRILAYARLGFGSIKAESRVNGGLNGTVSADFNTFIYGVGTTYQISPQLLLRGEWTVTDGQEKTVNGLRVQVRTTGFNVGLAYRF